MDLRDKKIKGAYNKALHIASERNQRVVIYKTANGYQATEFGFKKTGYDLIVTPDVKNKKITIKDANGKLIDTIITAKKSDTKAKSKSDKEESKKMDKPSKDKAVS